MTENSCSDADLNAAVCGLLERESEKLGLVFAGAAGEETDGKKTPMQVKVGEKVIYTEYAGTEVKFQDEEYIIVDQKDIIAIVE